MRVIADAANKVTGIEMQRMELGEPDASGRRRPVPVEGSEFVIECDQVIAAIGQFPKLDGTSEEQGVKRTKWRTIQVDDWTFQTEDPRVFAGGDVVLGAQTVIQAIAQGKKAAWSMDAYLRGEDMARGRRSRSPSSRPRRSSTRSASATTSTRASRAWPRSRRCSST